MTYDSSIDLSALRQLLDEHDFYVEYGAGDSSLLAVEMKIPTITIESDPFYSRKIAKVIRKKFKSANHQMLLRDIGKTKAWGYPKSSPPLDSVLQSRFRSYSDVPVLPVRNRVLVLVDGRFRVASALKALALLGGSLDSTVVVDDYLTRDRYRVIERHFSLSRMVGRMAVFSPNNCISDSLSIDFDISIFELDPY